MDIGDFISAFGTGYQRMQNKRSEDKDGKDKYLTKPTFCRELFCSITSNEGYVLYKNGPNVKTLERSPESFKAFYRNHQRRSLHPIANDIISLGALDEMKFRCFLEEYTVYCSKKTASEKLFQTYSRYNHGNAF